MKYQFQVLAHVIGASAFRAAAVIYVYYVQIQIVLMYTQIKIPQSVDLSGDSCGWY